MATKSENESIINDFLESIRNHPELWDKKNEKYKIVSEKPAIWEEIAKQHNFSRNIFNKQCLIFECSHKTSPK